MSLISLTAPPKIKNSAYPLFRPWLLNNFYDSHCSYCLRQTSTLQVDHYEPRSFAPDRVNDPGNLLLSCLNCGGPAGKHDYHPLHRMRRRRKSESSGFEVIDIRKDNFAEYFKLDPNTGKIDINPRSPDTTKSVKNLALLNLTLVPLTAYRSELLNVLHGLEAITDSLLKRKDRALYRELKRTLYKNIAYLTKREIFFYVFDIPIRHEIRKRMFRASIRAASLPATY